MHARIYIYAAGQQHAMPLSLHDAVALRELVAEATAEDSDPVRILGRTDAEHISLTITSEENMVIACEPQGVFGSFGMNFPVVNQVQDRKEDMKNSLRAVGYVPLGNGI